MILAIDATNWIHQLWHVHKSEAVLPEARLRLQALVSEHKPEAVIACFDRRSFRHNLSTSYKCSRGIKEPLLETLLGRAEREMAPDAQPVYQDGFEADDCLASIAAAAVASDKQCLLCSPDKDLWQCVSQGKVGVLRSFTTERGKVAKAKFMNERSLARWPESHPVGYDLRPWQWAEYQALVGESGDDVAGCPGWGEKTAARLLAKAGSIQAMLRDPWSLNCTKRQLAQLQTWAKRDMQLALDLVTLRTDVEAAWDALR